MWVALLKIVSLENLKTVGIVLAILAAVWFFKDYQFQKSENHRQSENAEQLRKYDSLKYATQTYSKDELAEFLEYQRQDLNDFLKKEDIKIKRIERIITQRLEYRDTNTRTNDLQKVLEAIKENKRIEVPVVDSTKCLVVRGIVRFENDSLVLDLTDRQFNNTTDVITHWERNQWKLLGIPTRLFGRKKVTVTIRDDCGKSKTFVIDTKSKNRR